MSGCRTLLLALMAMLFAASGIARAAPAPGGEPPPCHAMAMAKMDGHAAPHPAPVKKAPVHPADMMAMNCCLGCLPEPAAALGAEAPATTMRPVAFELGHALLDGLSPPPELGPPRVARS